MPKESKHSRGRREEKKNKRKREDGDEPSSKRRKSQDATADPAEEVETIALDPTPEDGEAPAERPFYGMLEDDEQEHFRQADEQLEKNEFESSEERSTFLASVFLDAEGKELKIACSQSCSRLMERLILLSTPVQKKGLFEKFAGNFSHLVQHRFASHCCEMLFIESATVVTQELLTDSSITKGVDEDGDEDENMEKEATMESLFLQTLDELEGNMTFLLTDRFASHTLRVLMVILSGLPLEKASTRSLLQSKRKEKVGIKNMEAPSEPTLQKRTVPASFQFAVDKIITDTVATMDTSFIRVLATHPTGNPTLQLLLELELIKSAGKKTTGDKTIISTLLPDDITTEGSDSSVFINGLLYDPIGSRLLETICTYAPGKLFKQIYRTTFKDRIAALARNEISSYVVIRVLQRLSKEDLEEAVEQINPQILGLVQRSRTVVIKTLIERCYARKATKAIETLTAAVAAAYDSDPATLVLKMACIDDIAALITTITTQEANGNEKDKLKPTPPQTHGSLLAQTLLSIPGPPATLLQTSLLSQPPPNILALALYTPTSHILQAALVPTATNTTFRRKLLAPLLTSSTLLTLALSYTGSHTLDSILHSTASTPPLFTLTERAASLLSAHESQLRDSRTGRSAWRNWILDLFGRKRGEWVTKIKELGAEKFPPVAVAVEEEPEKGNKKGGDKKTVAQAREKKFGKSAIQLARERHAKGEKKGFKLTGANSVSV